MAAAYAIIAARNLRRQRIFRDRLNPLDILDDRDLLQRYRLTRHLILDVCAQLDDDIHRGTARTHSLPVSLQVLVALRFFASGSFQNVNADVHNISKASVSLIVRDVSIALCNHSRRYIRFPPGSRRPVIAGFAEMANFPRVLGCIDCTHIALKAPIEDEHIFVNRKGYHSINVQAVCDHTMRFIDIVAKWPGSTHDAFIWSNSALCGQFEDGTITDGWLLGDSGYPLRPWLLTPVLHPTTQQEERYNTAHIRTRNIIERAFGVLKMRFRCLDKSGGTLYFSPIRTCRITVACVVLHNICIDNNIPLMMNDGNADNGAGDEPGNDGVYRGRQQDGAETRRRLIENRF